MIFITHLSEEYGEAIEHKHRGSSADQDTSPGFWGLSYDACAVRCRIFCCPFLSTSAHLSHFPSVFTAHDLLSLLLKYELSLSLRFFLSYSEAPSLQIGSRFNLQGQMPAYPSLLCLLDCFPKPALLINCGLLPFSCSCNM